MEKKYVQRLFMEHYAKMLRAARTILGDEQESKDVVSDVFANLLRGQTLLMTGSEERYLLTSVRNQCLKRLHNEEVKQRMVGMVTAELSANMCDVDERLADIDEFVATHFSQQEQRIFRHRFTDGCSYAEIAASEGISRVAVWKHLSHVLTLIRNHFKK